jgi:glycosyltransferase involved in cell wall biosynthesis
VRQENDAPFLLDVTRLIWRRWAGRHPTGIDRVCLAYLERFAPVAQAVIQHRRYRRILDRETSAILFGLLSNWDSGFRAKLIKSALRYGARPDCPGKGRFYLNIGHTGLDDPGLSEWVAKAGVRPTYFVHDLIPITHPEYCRVGEDQRHRARMRTVLSTATGIIANSQATIDELVKFAGAEELSRPPAIAAWLGTAPLPQPATTNTSDRSTFITLGTIEGRKNHLLLLQVWDQLARRLGAKAPQLLVIGQRGWEAEEAIDRLERSAVLKSSVIEIGGCDDRALAVHLAGARAMLFPSFAEGFGMPLMEALQIGTPAIASDLPVFREIGQGVPELLDPLDGAAWEKAILDYAAEGSARRDAQLDRLKRFRVPTWEDHFAKVEAWLARF